MMNQAFLEGYRPDYLWMRFTSPWSWESMEKKTKSTNTKTRVWAVGRLTENAIGDRATDGECDWATDEATMELEIYGNKATTTAGISGLQSAITIDLLG
ncbi:hypothetical protein E3N88_32942 [Mikania micrantha]|uniref:Uncharacterized protein n=1 Tax=Mikania micrantha TaxID=192012 RepID=A0A5N6MAE5_9ASTR|nr:hypothetical protein E3N88_32942 [Mikania micrantha]